MGERRHRVAADLEPLSQIGFSVRRELADEFGIDRPAHGLHPLCHPWSRGGLHRTNDRIDLRRTARPVRLVTRTAADPIQIRTSQYEPEGEVPGMTGANR